jgi:queuine tRNA-ribosyltransferase
MFQTQVLYRHKYTNARVVQVKTFHGEFTTPVYMPVGTRAGVNNITPIELKNAGSQIILGGNTYHMLCAPGMDVIKESGGMHQFMGWHGPMLTDSGGFQVFSLSKNKQICTIDEEGAHFSIPQTNRVIHMTPEMSLATQKIIGADIIMAFDQCTPDEASPAYVSQILNRTHRWLQQSVRFHQENPLSQYGYPQALFGIIQGGVYKELREESAQFITSMPVDGVAIGGETVGFDMVKTVEILKWLQPYLPENKPRYSMGVGMLVQDLLDVVENGVDMFDCVAPTRNARHGSLYSGTLVKKGNWLRFESEFEQGRLQIKKGQFSKDFNPIISECTCYTCLNYSRANLHDLYKQKATAFTALASIHNVHVMHEVCAKMRKLIIEESLIEEKE